MAINLKLLVRTRAVQTFRLCEPVWYIHSDQFNSALLASGYMHLAQRFLEQGYCSPSVKSIARSIGIRHHFV